MKIKPGYDVNAGRLKMKQFTIFMMLLMVLTACGSDEDILPYIAPVKTTEAVRSEYADSPIYRRHKDAPVKILAIGNSFTENATSHMAWMSDVLNGDSICVTKLTHNGCSLAQHWSFHVNDSPEYKFYYTDAGRWVLSEINKLDDALELFDWDIIVIQQASGESGMYASYQPYLDNLVELFRATNPNAKIAWHYTWPYRAGTEHPYFPNYNCDPLTMYEAILEAGDQASARVDLSIPAATLVREMRKEYPEVENGFSTDGYHISDEMALFALSTLWYECLVAPCLGTSSINPPAYPVKVDPEYFKRARNIIIRMMGYEEEPEEPDSVPMIKC